MCNYSCNLPKVFIPMLVASLTGTKVSLHYSTQYITYLCSVPLPYHFGTSMQYNLIMEKDGETKAWLRLFSHLPPCSPVTNPGPACVACSLTLKDSGLAALCLMVLVFCLLCLLLLLLVVVFLLVLLFNSDLMQPVASLVWQCQQKIPPKHMKWTCDLDIFRGCFAVGMVSAFGASYVSSKAMTTINRFSHDAWCLCAGPVGTIALARCRRSSSERPWAFSSVSEPFARPILLADAGDKCWSFWIQLIWKKPFWNKTYVYCVFTNIINIEIPSENIEIAFNSFQFHEFEIFHKELGTNSQPSTSKPARRLRVWRVTCAWRSR